MRSATESRNRRSRWGQFGALGVLAALLSFALMRGANREPPLHGKHAATGSPRPNTADNPSTDAGRRTPASNVSRSGSTEAPADILNPSSAECIAARARDAKRDASLAALSSAELETHVEVEASRPAPRDSISTRAEEACENTSEAGRRACLLVQVPALYLESELDERAMHAALRKHADEVASRGDARSLVAAAEILPVGSASAATGERPSGLGRAAQAIEWIVRAQRLGHDDALVQWSVARFTHRGADGESAELRRAQLAAIKRLPSLEPDNAAALLLAVSTAADGSSRLPTPAQLEVAAALPRFTEPVAARIALGLDALRGLPPLPAFRRVALRANRGHDTATHCASDEDVIQQMHLADRRVFQTHYLTPATFACTSDETQGLQSLQDACLRLFEHAHRGAQTPGEKALSATIAGKLATTPERRLHWQHEARRHDWQMSQYRLLKRTADPYVVAHFAVDGWRSGSEISGVHALLRSRGIPLEPPDGWEPGN